MTDVNLSQYVTEELVEILSRIADESKGDTSAMFEKLDIPVDLERAQSDELKKHLELIASGDKQDIEKLAGELEAASQESTEAVLRAAKPGGVTKWKVNWWGPQLFISHSVLAVSLDLVALAAAVARYCGPVAAAFATASGIAVAVLRIMDRGNGIILTKFMWVGPVIPTPQ